MMGVEAVLNALKKPHVHPKMLRFPFYGPATVGAASRARENPPSESEGDSNCEQANKPTNVRRVKGFSRNQEEIRFLLISGDLRRLAKRKILIITFVFTLRFWREVKPCRVNPKLEASLSFSGFTP